MRKVRMICVSLIMLSLVGCSNSGAKVLANETKQTITQKIAKGDSKAKIRKVFGDPGDVTYTDSGNEIWEYAYIDERIKITNVIPVVSLFNSGTTGTRRQLVVFFNNKDKVKKYNFGQSKHETNYGIIRQ